MMRHLGLVLVLVGAVALATGACTSSGGGGNGNHDAGGDALHQLDGGQSDDGGDIGQCTATGITVGSELAGYSGNYNAVFYDAYTSDASPYDYLEVGLYFDYGNPKPAIGPGTYTLGATTEEQNLKTCGTCVIAAKGCDDTAQTCEKYFFAKSGTLQVTKLNNGEGFVGTLTNARLVEVTIDEQGASNEVAGGESWCFTSQAFNQSIADYPLPCTSNTDCQSLSVTPTGATESGSCVQCLQESDCSSLTATPHCDTSYGKCVECATTEHCASSSYGSFCDTWYGLCGACGSNFDCHNASTPVCGSNETTYRAECVAGVTCTGDDPGAASDDGPAGARALTLGAAMNGAMCNDTDDYDWYKYQTSAAGNVTFTVAWSGADVQLGVTVYDATGTELGYKTTGNPAAVALTAQPAGLDYAEVTAYDAGSATPPIAYTVTVTTP